jgi:hypothetical protein
MRWQYKKYTVRVEEFFPMNQGAIRYLNDEKKDNLLIVTSC